MVQYYYVCSGIEFDLALEFMMYLFSLIHISYLIQKQKVIPIVAESTKWEFIDSMKDEKTQNVDEC